MTLTYAGRDRRHALYKGRAHSVIVDTRYLTAEVLTGAEAADADVLRPWSLEAAEPDGLCLEIAQSAVLGRQADGSALDLATSMRRGYTVPKRVRESAQAAASQAGLSAMSSIVAPLLASGRQVSCADVLWVHRFFEGSTAREAGPVKWAAWGGTDGRQWAGSLANRLEYDSVTADAGTYRVPGLRAFSEGDDDTRAFFGTLAGRGRVDGLFRQDGRGGWLAWGNGDWVAHPGPRGPRVELDDESALYAAGALLDAPDRPVDLRELDPHEWLVAAAGLPALDWEMIERTMTAAAGDPADPGAGDGDYTPEERSKNASGQLRDGNGRFAKVGDQGLMKSGLRGTIKTLNPQGNQIVVDAEDGNTYMIDPKDFEIDGGGSTKPGAPDPSAVTKPLDLTGILGQPRATATTPRAWLGRVLQPMGPVQLKQVVDDYEGFINSERQARAGDFRGGTGWEETKPETPAERKARAALKKDMKARRAEEKSLHDKYKGKAVAAAEEPPENSVTAGDALTPDNSDVKPLYLAIVDPDDPRAVYELVAVVPAGPNDSSATTYKRSGGEWVADPKILQDIKSATPPPVVTLEGDEYQAVLKQVDNEPDEAPADEPVVASGTLYVEMDRRVLALVSAGGADRNRGNAETLRRYWTVGKGGAKIRWNTGGDWRRCVRHLSKFLGTRSKGYCALRHHEMTGMWPGDRRNKKGYAMSPNGAELSSLDDIRRWPAVVRASAQQAAVEVALARVRGDAFAPKPVTAADIDEGRSGRAFKIPLVVPEGVDSGDKRHFRKGSLGIRTLPLPLMWQEKTGEGHDGSPIVGRIDHVERIPGGLGNAYGVFDTGPYGREAQRLMENGMLQWVSVDLDKFEVDEDETERDPDARMFIKKGRMMGATLVPKPAFQECTVELVPLAEEEAPMDVEEPVAISASAMIARSIPVEPPATWFDAPALRGPSPVHVTDEGQVFGHIATWTTAHIGMAGQTRPPRSRTNYAYFHTGLVRTEEGKDVRVGQLTLAGGHAHLGLDAAAAARHYDDTASALADVKVGEDSHGIWVAGALRPGTTPEQVRAFRASAPSGDWRSVNGGPLELVAICQVNVPGFPIPQAMAASGAMTALVAAGSADLLAMRTQEYQTEVEALAASARARVYLALDPDGYLTEFKAFPAAKREQLAKEKKALPDGSFPIENASDLRRAVHAYGRTTKEKQASVRRHIVRRARALGKADMIPAGWKEAGLSEASLDNRDRFNALVASGRQAKVRALAARMHPPTAAELAEQAEAARRRVTG